MESLRSVNSAVRCFRVGNLEMMKRILYVLKRGVSSRVGHLLLILHLSLVVWIFGQETPVPRAQNNAHREHYSSSQLLAGRGFHWHYESAELKLLSLVDLPGILLGVLIALILVPLFYFLPPLGA